MKKQKVKLAPKDVPRIILDEEAQAKVRGGDGNPADYCYRGPNGYCYGNPNDYGYNVP